MTHYELNHVALHVANVEKSKDFYINTLKLESIERPAFDFPGAWFRLGAYKQQEQEIAKKADEVMEFLNLHYVANELAGNLSGGQKKLLELGRTMMVDAKVVILDEVGAGVNRTLLKEIGDAIQIMNREKGYTFCMIEHDMDFISRLCNPVIVMAEGRKLTEGTAEEVKSNEEVIEAYLGRGATEETKKKHDSQMNSE